eukprot:Gb_10048 [translate_table: standard]
MYRNSSLSVPCLCASLPECSLLKGNDGGEENLIALYLLVENGWEGFCPDMFCVIIISLVLYLDHSVLGFHGWVGFCPDMFHVKDCFQAAVDCCQQVVQSLNQ